MTYLKKILKSYIKKAFSDLHSTIIGLVVAALILGVGGIRIFSKTLWNLLIKYILSPTPIWATIVLVLVLLVYIYLKTRTHPRTPPKLKPKHHTIDKLMWKYFVNNDKSFHVDETPLCAKHKLPMFKCDAGYDCHDRPVDFCKSLFQTKDYQHLYDKALSHIYRKINFPE